MCENILQSHNLTIGYTLKKESKVIQQHLNVGLKKGQLTALIGRNGAGKSTLLRTLCGLQKPIEGDIQINGKDIRSYSFIDRAKEISIVLTQTADNNLLTVKDIVSTGRQPYTNWLGLLDDQQEKMVEKALSTVHINHLTDRPIHQLSDGEKQRVWIAKALAQETPIIFLDEPTSHLDYKNRIEVFEILKALSSTGKAILISTHEIDLTLQYADQIWVLDQGIESGSAAETKDKGVLKRVFGYI